MSLLQTYNKFVQIIQKVLAGTYIVYLI